MVEKMGVCGGIIWEGFANSGWHINGVDGMMRMRMRMRMNEWAMCGEWLTSSQHR